MSRKRRRRPEIGRIALLLALGAVTAATGPGGGAGCGDEGAPGGRSRQRPVAGDGGEPDGSGKADLGLEDGFAADLEPATDAGSELDGGSRATDGGDGGSTPDPRFAELVALGKQRLAEARPRDALHLFEEAMTLDAEHPDALFGAALAGTIDTVELLSMILSLPGQLSGFAISRNEYVAEELHRQLLLLREGLVVGLERAEAIDPDALSFEVEAAWVYLGIRPKLVYRGVFDGGDLHLFRATISFVTALLDVVCGQDLRTDLLGAINVLRDGLDGLDMAALGRIAGLLFRPEPQSFLQIHPQDGAALFAAGREHLAAVGRELNLAVEWMMAQAETPDGRPQVSRLEELPGGSSWRLTVQNAVKVEEGVGDGAAGEQLQPELLERPMSFTFRDRTLEAFAHASTALDRPGELVCFRTEAVPVLATILHAALQLGLLDSLTGSLPIDLGALDREAVEVLLGNLLPLPAALDMGSFFSRPVGLAPFFPRLGDEEPARFLAEWECPEELDGRGYPAAARGILCSAEALLTDAAHFDGQPWALAADGITARLPYLVWEDPTFNGLLLVDRSALPLPVGGGEPGYAPPDLFVLDALLASSLTALLVLLGGLLG
ncbi:MAG: hypothetical protein FJ125_05640 [Deltaproteobacteria bacterium]|nr:hypothetical protein [Deltaproteobacteria bacterium]